MKTLSLIISLLFCLSVAFASNDRIGEKLGLDIGEATIEYTNCRCFDHGADLRSTRQHPSISEIREYLMDCVIISEAEWRNGYLLVKESEVLGVIKKDGEEFAFLKIYNDGLVQLFRNGFGHYYLANKRSDSFNPEIKINSNQSAHTTPNSAPR